VHVASLRGFGNDGVLPLIALPLRSIKVSELPNDEQSEVRRALSLFYAHGELQMASEPGPDLQAKIDSIALMPLWTDAVIFGWGPGDFYARPSGQVTGGLVYWAKGESITVFELGRAVTKSGRVFERRAA
jgi:hypothetical protein